MAILFSNEIFNAVINELKQAESSVQIITAYCKENTFKHFVSSIGPSVTDKRIMIRFRMEDIIKGSTDFDVIKYALDNGWRPFIRFDLHAKTYIVDNKRGLVGSANLTNSGLSVGRTGNMEMAAFVDIDSGDVNKINRLFDDAVEINENLIARMEEQLDKIRISSNGEICKWNDDIIGLFNPHVDTLFSHELPEECKVEKGEYISFLDLCFDGNVSSLKESFRWSNAYIWLLTTLEENDGCMYFGGLTEKLHNSLITDPKPFRRDVKQMLSNLLSLVETLNMDEIIIDRPNYSQRVRLK